MNKLRIWLPLEDSLGKMLILDRHIQLYDTEDGYVVAYTDYEGFASHGLPKVANVDEPMWGTSKIDVNQKEAFVGDFIKILNESPATKREYWYPQYEIIHDGWSFGIKYIGGGLPSDNLYCFQKWGQFEIIGNIYENPEIKTKNK